MSPTSPVLIVPAAFTATCKHGDGLGSFGALWLNSQGKPGAHQHYPDQLAHVKRIGKPGFEQRTSHSRRERAYSDEDYYLK